MDHANSKGLASLVDDPLDLDQRDGEFTKIESTEQDIPDPDLPELSRQLNPPRSPRVKQENDDEIGPICVENANSPCFSGRFKEELGLEDEKGAVNQVFVGENIKLKIKLEHGYRNSPETRFPFNQARRGSNGMFPLRGPGQRSIATPLSPYCRVIINPSWETSKVYLK
jgi:hypothetical protein